MTSWILSGTRLDKPPEVGDLFLSFPPSPSKEELQRILHLGEVTLWTPDTDFSPFFFELGGGRLLSPSPCCRNVVGYFGDGFPPIPSSFFSLSTEVLSFPLRLRIEDFPTDESADPFFPLSWRH